ncbi:glycosyltransferase [Brucella anthropi]|uniref:glycosyltransferase n=1 Tax=Brucella anthropi TaxID=529 RepID=UPI000F66246C|nr:glycosyltransferase [Brucella anthropi]RRY06288.1 glycosyltransferase [Brucella anthropi]UGQ21737.1 glycosyltransferase [Brucella anthropi]
MNESEPAAKDYDTESRFLTISIVTFNPVLTELGSTLDSLQLALEKLNRDKVLITIIDNSKVHTIKAYLDHSYPELPIRLIHGQGNIGFGRAHNLALDSMGEFHLILNPDIRLDPDALAEAIDFMLANSQCGLLSPYAEWPSGQRQYLCKQYPAIFDFLLRGFSPKLVQSFFRKRLASYEMQLETQDIVFWNPPIVSGCFMLFAREALLATKGFDDHYFLYFEDFDLSLRVGRITHIAYVPSVRIVHAGGNASKKGFRHICIFIRSAAKFYMAHGLRFL